MITIQQTMNIFPYHIPREKTNSTGSKTLSPSAPDKSSPSTIRRHSMNISTFSYELSKCGIQIGRNQIFKWLRENGFISKQKSTWNMPIKKYVDQNILVVKETYIIVGDEQIPKYSPLIPDKGFDYFINKIKESINSSASRKIN